jgi:hypothetical protein
MKTKLRSLVALVCLLGLSPANASTYDVGFALTANTTDNVVSVTGTIVTNCDSCALDVPTDFVSWTFTFIALTLESSNLGRGARGCRICLTVSA